MDAFGPALSSADHVVLTDIYPAGEDPIPGVTLEALAAAVRRSVTGPVDVVPRLEDVAAGGGAARAARRRGDHAGRRIDRHGARSVAGLAGREREGQRMSPVAAPSDRRFRRAHVKPARRRGSWRGLVKPVLKYGLLTWPPSTPRTAAARSSRRRRVLRVDRIVVQGNERLSHGEVLAVLTGLRGENIVWTDLDRLAPAASVVSVGARRGAAALAAVDGRSDGLGARADRHRPDQRASCTSWTSTAW